mmetsp:Transcript_72238/g.217126  ORF Transcript_72238/g.217126 Transcript_72238/m.217126 type:complete len:143 (-) Transcript_72238:622-1050(-)
MQAAHLARCFCEEIAFATRGLSERRTMFWCRPCTEGRDSIVGSGVCTICASGYYRTNAGSAQTQCGTCDTMYGVSCLSNSTIETLQLHEGHWRHSARTLDTWACKTRGSWTPWLGGTQAGADGDGYCVPGHWGPRCERDSVQ